MELDTGKVRLALGDPDTPAIVLMTIALWTLGDAVFGNPEAGIEAADSAEMWADLHTAYGTWVTEEGENKLNALITGLTNGAFWDDEEVFVAVATALYDGDLGDLITGGFEELTVTEILWAILEMGLAWDDEDTPEFSRSVSDYIEAALGMEQEDHSEVMKDIQRAYRELLDQLVEMGVPETAIRTWDEDYVAVADIAESGQVS